MDNQVMKETIARIAGRRAPLSEIDDTMTRLTAEALTAILVSIPSTKSAQEIIAHSQYAQAAAMWYDILIEHRLTRKSTNDNTGEGG